MKTTQIKVDPLGQVEDKKPVAILSRDELVDVFGKELKHQHIDTIDDLLNWLKFDLPLSDTYSTEAYITLLKKELVSKVGELPKFSDPVSIGNYLASKYASLEIEELHLISVDNSNRIIADDCLSRGTKNRSLFDYPEVLKKLVANNATGFFLTHNHPSGDLKPSQDDLDITEKLIPLTKFMHIDLLDHIITGNGQYLSMKERDLT